MLYSFPPQQPTRIDPYNVPTFNYHNYHIYTQLCICVKVAYFAYIFHFHFHFNMALYLSNIFGCFSESSSPQSKRYECNGDVCVLRNPKENINKKASNTNNKQKQFSRFSIKWSPRSRFWIARLMILLQTGWLVLLIHQCNSLCSIYILFFFFFGEDILYFLLLLWISMHMHMRYRIVIVKWTIGGYKKWHIIYFSSHQLIYILPYSILIFS